MGGDAEGDKDGVITPNVQTCGKASSHRTSDHTNTHTNTRFTFILLFPPALMPSIIPPCPLNLSSDMFHGARKEAVRAVGRSRSLGGCHVTLRASLFEVIFLLESNSCSSSCHPLFGVSFHSRITLGLTRAENV